MIFKMATCRVRFEFLCIDSIRTLTFFHDLPRSLITTDQSNVARDTEYCRLFLAAVGPILKEHTAVSVEAAGGLCGICQSSSVTVLLTPTSLLYTAGDPLVRVLVDPICEKKRCEIRMRQEAQDAMADAGDIGGDMLFCDSGCIIPNELLICKVCGEMEGAKKCFTVSGCSMLWKRASKGRLAGSQDGVHPET